MSNNIREDQLAQACTRLLICGNILTKTTINKLTELESSSKAKAKVKFNKDVIPKTRTILQDIFHYDLVDAGNGDLTAINNLPDNLKALKYSFCVKNTVLMANNDMKQLLGPKSYTQGVTVYGDGLPKPTNTLVEQGFILLVIFLIVIYGNRIKQSELEDLLNDKFGITSMPLNLSIIEKRGFILRGMADDLKKKVNDTHDSALVVVKLGKRVFVEWDRDHLLGAFQAIMASSWDDNIERRCEVTLDKVFSTNQ